MQDMVGSAGHERRWTALIDTVCDGSWVNPRTGNTFPPAPFKRIAIADDLLGAEATLVQEVGLTGPFAVVADEATWEAMGSRVSRAIAKLGAVRDVILKKPHPDLANARLLTERIGQAQSVIAVGSGTVNDVCKYVTAQLGLEYCVFGTAASMNGYTSPTASMTLDSGLKVSLPAHAPSGVFLDLRVSADAPQRLSASGFGDTICRSVAQIDWWMSHRLLGTSYY